MVNLVDREQIKMNLTKYWHTRGKVTITKTGVVNCTGDVMLTSPHPLQQLPFAWGRVGGSFDISGMALTTLAGCPREVHGPVFTAQSNKLTNLEHGPVFVAGQYKVWGNNLTSLDGMPDHCKEFLFRYSPDLPLLQTLKAQNIRPMCSIGDSLVCGKIREILNKYAGTTNSADILKCASELNEAGFEGNAEW